MLLHQRTTVIFKPKNRFTFLFNLQVYKKMHASIAVIYPLQQLT